MLKNANISSSGILPMCQDTGTAIINGYKGLNIFNSSCILVNPKTSVDAAFERVEGIIAHEYFHVYQHSLSPAFSIGSDGEFSNPNAMDVKWLIEGSAATFESIYIQENYGINYFEEGQAWGVQDDVLSDPAYYEYFSKEDNNYANSVFMILALVKELESNDDFYISAFWKLSQV